MIVDSFLLIFLSSSTPAKVSVSSRKVSVSSPFFLKVSVSSPDSIIYVVCDFGASPAAAEFSQIIFCIYVHG